MKTITDNTTKLSLFLYNDDRTVTIGSNGTVVAATTSDKYESIGENILPDVKSSTHTLHTDVTEPTNWQGTKYTFDGTTWALNSNFKIVCEKYPCIQSVVLNNYDDTKCSECGEDL